MEEKEKEEKIKEEIIKVLELTGKLGYLKQLRGSKEWEDTDFLELKIKLRKDEVEVWLDELEELERKEKSTR